MFRPKRHAPIVVLALTSVLVTCCDSGTGIEDAAARVEKVLLSDEPRPPDAGGWSTVPADGVLAVDFGAVEVGAPRRVYLVLHNSGESDLLLSRVEPVDVPAGMFFLRCPHEGQFTGDCPQGKGTYLSAAPGDDLILELEYAPQQTGSHQATFGLHLNAADHPLLRLELSGRAVERRLQLCATDCTGDQNDPACHDGGQVCGDGLVVLFGDLTPGTTARRELTVENIGDQELTVSRVRIEGDHHDQYSWQPIGDELPGVIAAGQFRVVEVTYAPASGGAHQAALRVESDGGQAQADLGGRMLAPRACPEPLALDFGTVEVGTPREMSFALINCGLAPLSVDGVALADASSDFSMGTLPDFPQLVGPGEQIEIAVVYAPQSDGSDDGGVDIYSDDITADPDTGLTGTVALFGRGVVRECRMVATPFRLDFGPVEQGADWERQLLLSNQGTDSCVFEEADVTANSAADEFSLTTMPAAGTVFEPGEVLELGVRYTPVNLGADSGLLEVQGGAGADPLAVELSGEGVAEAACDLWVHPQIVDFGLVEPLHTRSMVVTLANMGPAPCGISGLELLPSATYASDFSQTGGPAGTLTLARRGEAGDRAQVEISFAPAEEGDHAAVLWLHTDDDPDFQMGNGICVRPGWPPESPGPGDACIPVAGRAVESDLEVVPDGLDFGVVTVGCNAPALRLTVYNLGYFTVRVESVGLDVPGDPNFEITEAPPAGYALGWGGSFEVEVRYHPQDAGPHHNAVVIETDDFDIPRMVVPLRGEGTHVTGQTDVFTQADHAAVDVLFVVDNSGSMGEEQTALADNFNHFISWAVTREADFHIGVITTMASGSEVYQGEPPRDIEAGELVAAPGRPAVLDPDTPELIQAFRENVHVGTSPTASTEQGLEAARLALTPPKINTANAGFVRTDARLILVVVSDEDDQSPAALDYYLDVFSALKGPRDPERMDISVIVGDTPDGCQGAGGEAEACERYLEAATRTGGLSQSICTDDWGSALEDIGLDSFAPRREFPLTRPADPASIEVQVDGMPVPQAPCPGCDGGWSYYLDTNAVWFAEDVLPGQGARIEVSYQTMCL